MSLPTTYLLNVALHAGILSVFATLLLAFLRSAGQRSFIAIAGILTVGFLPWITALRPAPAPVALPLVTEVEPAAPPAELPIWTIVTMPVTNEAVEPLTAPSLSTAKWELPDFPTILVTLWAAGTGIGLALLGLALIKVMVWKKSLAPIDNGTWRELRDFVPYHVTQTDFLICPTNASPCVVGFWRPKIVIPRFLLDQHSTEKLQWTVRHEIAHWQAGDSRWAMLFALIRCVNWWSPFSHHLAINWADAREQLCDLHATSHNDDRADYGEFLITMAGKITKQPPLAVTMAKRVRARRLKHRIVSLLESKPGAAKPINKGFVSIGSGMFILIAACVSVLKIGAEEIPDVSKPPSADEDVTYQAEKTEEQKSPSPLPSAASPATNEPKPPSPAAAPLRADFYIKFSSRFVLLDSADPEIGFINAEKTDASRFTIKSQLSEGQMQMIMRGLSQKKGRMLMTLPSVSCKPGQNAKIDIVRQIAVFDKAAEKTDIQTQDPFVGVSISCETHAIKDFIPVSPPPVEGSSHASFEIKQTVDYRYIPGVYQPIIDLDKQPSKQSVVGDLEKIKTIKHTFEGTLYSGYTVWKNLGEVEPGKSLIMFTRIDAIDATGRRLDGIGESAELPMYVDRDQEREFDKAVERKLMKKVPQLTPSDTVPSAEVRGRLKISGTRIDLPRDPTLPENVRNHKKLFFSDEGALDALAEYYKLDKHPLKQVRIPTNKRSVPWPEFPEISLSVLLSKQFRNIALSNDSEANGSSLIPDMKSGDMAAIDVPSGDPAIERRIYIKVEIVE